MVKVCVLEITAAALISRSKQKQDAQFVTSTTVKCWGFATLFLGTFQIDFSRRVSYNSPHADLTKQLAGRVINDC